MPTEPAAPTLTAAPNATSPGTAIDLSWPAPHNGGGVITGYALEHSTDGIAFASLSGYDDTSLSYAHTELSPGTTHYYRASATNSRGTSAYSDVESTTTYTIPDAPASLRAVAVGAEQIDLSWTAGPDGGATITSYILEVSEDKRYVQQPRKP